MAATHADDPGWHRSQGGGGGIEEVTRVAAVAYLKAALSLSDAKNFLFFPRTPDGKKAAKAYLRRLKERNRRPG